MVPISALAGAFRCAKDFVIRASYQRQFHAEHRAAGLAAWISDRRGDSYEERETLRLVALTACGRARAIPRDVYDSKAKAKAREAAVWGGKVRRANTAIRDSRIRAQENAKAAWRLMQSDGVEISYSQCKRIFRRPVEAHEAAVELAKERAMAKAIVVGKPSERQKPMLRQLRRRRWLFIPVDDPTPISSRAPPERRRRRPPWKGGA